MIKSQIFKNAHTAAKLAMAEQIEIKHPSLHKTYRQLFSLALRGYYVGDAYKHSKSIEWATVGGTHD